MSFSLAALSFLRQGLPQLRQCRFNFGRCRAWQYLKSQSCSRSHRGVGCCRQSQRGHNGMLIPEAGGEYRVDPVCAMTRRFIYAALISTAAAPGFAQTTATPYSVTNRGIVALGNTTSLTATTTGVTANPATPAQSAASSTAPGTTPTVAGSPRAVSTGAATGAGNTSTLSGASQSTTSRPNASRAASSASAAGAAGSAPGAASSNVPTWLLCPPSGVSGMEPFVVGTSLSCAP